LWFIQITNEVVCLLDDRLLGGGGGGGWLLDLLNWSLDEASKFLSVSGEHSFFFGSPTTLLSVLLRPARLAGSPLVRSAFWFFGIPQAELFARFGFAIGTSEHAVGKSQLDPGSVLRFASDGSGSKVWSIFNGAV